MHSDEQLYGIEYRKKNHDRIYERNKKYRVDNIEKCREYARKSFRKNRDKVLARNRPYGRKRYQQKRFELLEYSKKYRKENPHKFLEYRKKELSKLGKIFNIKYSEYSRALMIWSQAIRKDFNDLCFCGNKAILTHHIIHKSTYPELSLNLNNGIALCQEHHYEVHGKRG